MIISHIIYFLVFFTSIHLYFVPWPMIDNPTSCDRIMYSSLIFHPKTCVKQSTFISHINEIVTKKASNKR